MESYAPPAAPARETVGKVLTVLASVFGPPAAVVAAFFASIEWSGCFIECNSATDTPDHLTGGLLWLLALAFLTAGPVLAAVLVRRPAWVLGAVAAPVVEALLVSAGTLAR
jgi:hypothetical protein